MHEAERRVEASGDGIHWAIGEDMGEELLIGRWQCVEWTIKVKYLVISGLSSIVEYGPVGVLSGVIKRIDKNVKTVPLTDPASIQNMLAAIA